MTTLVDKPFPVTVFTGDAESRLTKSYRLSEEGEIIKDGRPNFIEGHAETVSLQSLSDLADLIDTLNQNQCIATGVFDIPKCRVVTKDAIDENSDASGVRARSKDYMRQPDFGVVLLDYDPSPNMPERLRHYSPKEVIDTIRMYVPGFRKVGYIGRASSSSGVHATTKKPDMPKGFHIYCLFENGDLPALKKYLEVKLWNEGYGYIEFARNGALLPRTLIDLAVLSPERLIYEAAPILGPGLSRAPSPWKYGEGGPIDCDLKLTEEELLEYKKKLAAAKAEAQEQSPKYKEAFIEEKASQVASDQQIPLEEAKQRISVEYRQKGECTFLPSNFPLEVQGKTMMFGDFMKRADLDGVSMPDPIEGRGYGQSTAKFFYNKGLNPCVNSFAHGGQIYKLKEEFDVITEACIEAAPEDELTKASNLVDGILEDVPGDVGIVFRADIVAALRVIRHQDPQDYQRLRTLFKEVNSKISVQELDRVTVSRSRTGKSTHDGYAKELLQMYTVETWEPIGYEDQLYVLNADSSVWEILDSNELIKTVSKEFDGQPNCSRANDYKDIVKHAITISSQSGFFDDAPTGVACSEGFYRVEAGQMIREELLPSHRQRLRLDYTPKDMPTPRFDQFLLETFGVEDQEEQTQQIQVVQEIFGGIMLGILHRYQKAILFYDPIGRAGKGTIVDIIKSLLPKKFITSVSPYRFDEEYYLASMMTSRLNVAGEMDSRKTIPENVMKMITGGDDITGRHPAGRPMTFKSQAAQLFMSNHMIRTSDRGEAFFARWQFVEFPNSRLRSSLPLDPDLAQTIIDEERPGIANWALQGGIRLLEQKCFGPSKAHDRLMKEWRRWADSLLYFIQEACETGDKDFSVKRSDFYSAYEEWCDQFGITPEKKRDVMDRIVKFPRYNISTRRTNGYDTYYGIKLQSFDVIDD